MTLQLHIDHQLWYVDRHLTASSHQLTDHRNNRPYYPSSSPHRRKSSTASIYRYIVRTVSPSRGCHCLILTSSLTTGPSQPDTMDYLDLLATRSLILFSPPTSTIHLSPLHTDDSPNTTPQTPNTGLPDPAAPEPVSMPIQSLIEGSSDCHYFLITHVLATAIVPSAVSPVGSPGSASSDSNWVGGGSLGGTPKELIGEAELLVWKEMDKAKMFGRELGQWFRGHGNSRISEMELAQMAAKWGLKVKPVDAGAAASKGRDMGRSERLSTTTRFDNMVIA